MQLTIYLHRHLILLLPPHLHQIHPHLLHLLHRQTFPRHPRQTLLHQALPRLPIHAVMTVTALHTDLNDIPTYNHACFCRCQWQC